MGKIAQIHPRSNNSANKNNNSSIGANGIITKVKRTRKTVPRDSPPQRSSIYRGVTRHRWTGRYEAHLWDKNCWNESQNKKGRQVYLGAYDDEETAAHAYDLAALKYWGQETILNFPLESYEKELKEMEGQSREEYIGSLRRKSSGFSRGVSKYRGVARHHHNGRWEARIGRVFGNKYLYLGTYATQEEAAVAYDMAAIEYRGLNAVTNFDLSRYIKWLKPDSTTNTAKPTPHPTDPIIDSTNVVAAAPVVHDQLHPRLNTVQQQQQEEEEEEDQLPLMVAADAPLPRCRPTTATSALGLLLQSSKFKEMMEMTSLVENSAELILQQPMESKQERVHTNFPEDIQTYFESQDYGLAGAGTGTGGAGDFFFGDLNSFMHHPMLHCDF